MRSPSRRTILTAAAGSALSALGATSALAAAPAWPSKPVSLLVGYPPGGLTDAGARFITNGLASALGQPVVVENKPGASGNLAAAEALRLNDSHKLLVANTSLTINPHTYATPSPNPLDFTPIGLLARFPLILVVPEKSPVKNWKEFVAWAKAAPDGVSYASAGLGSPHHLATELLRERSGLKFTHVPYKGAAPAVQDLIGGQLAFGLMDSASVQQYIAAGKLRAIGVASSKRLATFSQIPTLAEQGVAAFEAYAWQGLVVPAGTPAPQVAQLARALQQALDSTPVKARFQTLSLEAMPGTPGHMTAFAKAERERWGKLIRDNGIRLD